MNSNNDIEILIDRISRIESRELSPEMKATIIEAVEYTNSLRKFFRCFGTFGGFLFHATIKISAFLAAVAVIVSYWPFGGGK